jgi:hypothetical protein
MWVIVASSVLAVCSFAVYRMWRPACPPDLGWVSERWLVEQRAYQPASRADRCSIVHMQPGWVRGRIAVEFFQN